MEKPSGESKSAHSEETQAEVIDFDPKTMPVVFLIALYAFIWVWRERCVC